MKEHIVVTLLCLGIIGAVMCVLIWREVPRGKTHWADMTLPCLAGWCVGVGFGASVVMALQGIWPRIFG